MQFFESAEASAPLRPFVTAYAQRSAHLCDQVAQVQVPSRVEPVLEFQLADRFELKQREFAPASIPDIAIVTPKCISQATLAFTGHVLSFAIFFRPSGFTRLFGVPLGQLNMSADAIGVIGSNLRGLRERLGGCASFESRIEVIELFLLGCVEKMKTTPTVSRSADMLLEHCGNLRIDDLAKTHAMSVREYERRFLEEFGLPPKRFATICRFQSALDLKLKYPKMPWLDITFAVGYHDQMHLIHAFKHLGGGTPGSVIGQITGVRPEALLDANLDSATFT